MIRDREQSRLADAGARIRALRESRGLNLHELARLSGISASALSLIENGKRDLRVTSLYRIAEALRVSAGDLLDGEAGTAEPRSSGSAGYDLGDYT
jgi:transcriptional regulator with XRE-family HTH domain